MRTLRPALAALIGTLAVAAGAPAIAGGDNYDAAADTEGKGPSYFGFVRDNRGSAVPGAQVMLKPKSGEPVVLKTNAVGLYRSHISKDVRPADVDISCAKDGYQQMGTVRRAPPGAANIETDCTLKRL